jgi:hypothetical protein
VIVDPEVAEAGMVYPVNQHGEIARHMLAVGPEAIRALSPSASQTNRSSNFSCRRG